MTAMLRPALAALIPTLFTAKDGQQPGAPLRGFLDALDIELDALRAAIAALVDDHFVERASPEALPLLAELLGARLLGSDPGTNRAVVARSVAWRRRRGTLAALEEVLSATSGWSAEVDEGFRSLLFTQDHRAPTPERGRLPAIWDPIPLADPLARRPARADHRRDEAAAEALRIDAALQPGSRRDEDATLRRLGRADAGRYAASPRTVDLRGWARPEGVLIRTARLFPVELEAMAPGPVTARADGRRVFALDPLGRGGPMVWRQPLERADLIPERTARHEPEAAPAPARRAATLLTPTALAADPAAVEASTDVQIAVAGIPLVGPPAIVPPRAPLAVAPAGPSPDLRLADPGRLPEGQRLTLTLVAARSDGDRTLLAVTEAGPGAGPATPLVATADARRLLPGATLALRVRREGGRGALRATGTAGIWSAQAALPPSGPARGPVVVVLVNGGFDVLLVRPEGSPAGTLRLASLAPETTPAAWQPVSLAGDPPPPDAPGLAVAASGADARLYLVGDDGSGALGAWRATVADDGGAADSVRLDDPAQRRPPARAAAAACLRGDGRLFVHGGFDGLSAREDMWSLDTSAAGPAAWRFEHVRGAPARGEATLLEAFGGLVLLGGETVRGQLEISAWFCEPTLPRPIWRPLPPLPIGGAGADRVPGALVARVDGAGGIEALVWADRTRPRRLTLGARPTSWTAGPLETTGAAPPPPASGEAVFLPDGALLVADAPPLPPFEVIVGLGGEAHLAFVPALDVAAGEELTFDLFDDGTARRRRPPGELPPSFARGPHEPRDERAGEGRRLGVPGRLGRHLYQLRQRILGDASDPALLPDADDVVGLDPRGSRVILPAGAPAGALTISYVVGRGGPIGAGCLPVDRALPEIWQEPDLTPPGPPDLPLAPGLPPAAEVTAWVSPPRAGDMLVRRGRERPVVATLEEGLDLGRDAAHPVLSVLGSPRLPPARLESRSRRGFSLVAADFGSTPMIEAPDDPDLPSLALYAGAAVGADADGLEGDPADALWLAGLWVAGRTDVSVVRGRIDARFCTLGEPGGLGLRVAGAGHQGPLGRRSLHPVELELRLYGCQVGALEVPPWVRVYAAGCTFDAGGSGSGAVRAAGAQVRLRHCTIRGTVEAGELRASSCVVDGAVRVDRTDLGWIRYSLLRFGVEQPRTHHCLDRAPSFGSLRPLDPTYLVLGANNGAAALAIGEEGRLPGAYADRHARQRELLSRTELHLPIGLRAEHLDRLPPDLARMGRRSP